MRFSVVIPAYNAEKTIGNCLESVINQDFSKDDYEIIVVDDCSPDNQNNVIRRYIESCPKKQYPKSSLGQESEVCSFIRLIRHNENKRQGGARNTAIRAAHGEWILFIDADDYWCSPQVLSIFDTLIRLHQDVQIFESIIYNRTDSLHTSTIRMQYEQLQISAHNPFDYYQNNSHPCIWSAAYSHKHIANILFRENVAYEDTDWKIRVFTSARKIITFNFPFYAYYNNSESTTNVKNLKVYEDAINADIVCRNEWRISGLPERFIKEKLASGKKYYIKKILDIRHYSINDGCHLLGILNKSGYRMLILKDLNAIEYLLSCFVVHAPKLTSTAIQLLARFKRAIK